MQQDMDRREEEATEEYERRKRWLESHGRREGDMMEDERGEYVLVDYEEGLTKQYYERIS